MKEIQPDEFAPGESNANEGATGIFGVVKSSAVPAPDTKASREGDAASSPPTTQTTKITTREVVFKATDHATFEDTDALRRILDPTQAPTTVTVAPAVETSGAGGFTQLLRAMSPHPAAAVEAAPVPAAGPAIPPDASSGTMKAHPEPGATPQSDPVAGMAGDQSSTQKLAEPPVVPPSGRAPVEAVSSQNVGFTQLFQSFKGHTAVPASPAAVPLSPTSVVSTGWTPDAPPARKEEQSKPVADAVFSQPVSIPDLAREILHEVHSESVSLEDAAGRGNVASAAEARPQPVGSFTQLFQTLAKPGGPAAPDPVKTAPVASPPGDSGSFTQLFSSLGSRPPAQATQADSFPPLSSSTQPSHGGFRGDEVPGGPPRVAAYPAPSYREPDYREPRPSEAVFSSPPPPLVSSPAEGGGDMTRLLRRLDSASYGQAPTSPSKVEPLPLPLHAPESNRGPITPDGATVAFRMPESTPTGFRGTPAEPVGSTGQGSMTRILDASALRESIRKGGGHEASAAAPLTDAAAPSTGGGGSFPAMPAYPGMPSMQMPPAQPHPMQMPQVHLPQIPQVQTPQLQMPKAEAPAGGGKSWVPILLMVIIVLLVGILLAVVLLMKK